MKAVLPPPFLMGQGQLQDGAGSRLRKAHPQGLALNLTQTKLSSIKLKTGDIAAKVQKDEKQCCHDKTMKPVTPMATIRHYLPQKNRPLAALF
jgi:uncharacterized cupredoxin-like copper-binding protein